MLQPTVSIKRDAHVSAISYLSLLYDVVLKLSIMADEQEIRSKAQSSGLNKQQEDSAVQIAKDNPNLSADEVVQQAKSK
jgi:hypothetical protein